MPDGVVVGVFFVVFEEIRASRVVDSLQYDGEECVVSQFEPKRVDDGECSPAHGQVECQGETRVLAECDNLADDTGNDARPEEAEDCPTGKASQYAQADRRVTAGNHDVDAGVIKYTQVLLVASGKNQMV